MLQRVRQSQRTREVKRRSGRGPILWCGARGPRGLLSLRLKSKERGSSRTRREVTQNQRKRKATLGMPLFCFKRRLWETIAGFPSASRPLHSSPSGGLILKLLKLFAFLLTLVPSLLFHTFTEQLRRYYRDQLWIFLWCFTFPFIYSAFCSAFLKWYIGNTEPICT